MKHFYLIGLTFLVLACSMNKNFVITDDYAGKTIKDKSLGIVYIPSEPVIESSYVVTKLIEDGDPQKVFKNFFTKSLIKNLKQFSYFKSIEILKPVINEQFKTVELTLNKKRKLKFVLPEEGYKIKTDSTTPDFILFIQNLAIDQDQGNYYHPRSVYARQYGKFLFWDNIQSKIVSYGEFDTSGDFSTLNDDNKDIVLFDILDQTPFSKNALIQQEMMDILPED